ncbi:uncharacterized protein Aud_006661 [Aspergillus udagawae]|uniref:DUF7580 domain-containing protein n=1 Tax=Aspergillus udagawae TaxID=91492 RepID=A0A8E0QVR6_9EURO|nr:uncharacterized protein Aud_006661 [Aspergillus udagawae]GIC90229.1 hypothetical protein Aud_006661 [Aspergillus udagawae]
MVTGIEATGVVLALLPLLVNQLDNYVQGLETLKSFRAKRYLRELESYRTNLGTQKVIFLNTLGLALRDTLVDDKSIIKAWIRNPQEDKWVGRVIHETLQTRLGPSFEPFMRTTGELSNLLEDLSNKLGSDQDTRPLGSESESFIKRSVKKFRDIFSKSIYAGLLSRIHTTNTILKTLVDQSFQHHTKDNDKWKLRQPLSVQKSRRKLALSLYSAILNGDCWNCPCKDRHSIRFVLDISVPDLLGTPHQPSNHTFRMTFTSKRCTTSADARSCWHEVEAESIEISDPASTYCTCPCPSRAQLTPSDTNKQKAKPSCQLNHSELKARDPLGSKGETPVPTISDLCSTIFAVSFHDKQRELLGCIADKRYRHHMYHVRSIADDLQSHSQSLEELIATSSTFPQPLLQGKYIFSRRDRLILAVNLACSVLQFHGNWLRKYWRARDIKFMKEKFDPSEHPYVVCDIAGEPSMDENKESSPLIRSEVLFPLGLILVELSLCRNLESLRTLEDADPLEAVANLKTAARYLPVVEMESGLGYGQVVKWCLFGSDTVDTTLEDEIMQEKVFENVVARLVENLWDFSGPQLRKLELTG